MGTASSCPRRILLGDVAQESLNYRWRGTRGTHLTARLTSTITVYRTKLERRARIRTGCYSGKGAQGWSRTGADGENVDSKYHYSLGTIT
jgi:hypothetical protein